MTEAEFIQYCETFVDLPYVWGGEGPGGYDCSGLAQKLLAALALDPPGDQNAHALYVHFRDVARSLRVDAPCCGALAFFGKPNRIGHVGVCVDGTHMIEAAHGDDTCTSPAAAAKKGAKVEINLVTRRPDLVAILRPSGLPW